MIFGLREYACGTCYDSGWRRDEKKCPYTFEKLEEQYPQCFTENRPDNCGLYRYKKENLHLDDIFGLTKVAVIYSDKLDDFGHSPNNSAVYSNGAADLHYINMDFF
ncbi:MAG: hypothetical protein LBB59_05485 [Campylobacteraceae bacterium]|nr:hypothetical protein [Campylobacteraceae bacterium]